MADTFVPPKPPAPGSGWQRTLATRRIEYGDGYTQLAPDGVNVRRIQMLLSWPLLSHADADAIATFFETQIGKSFLYDPPWITTGAGTYLWSCAEWSRSEPTSVSSEIQATLAREFHIT